MLIEPFAQDNEQLRAQVAAFCAAQATNILPQPSATIPEEALRFFQDLLYSHEFSGVIARAKHLHATLLGQIQQLNPTEAAYLFAPPRAMLFSTLVSSYDASGASQIEAMLAVWQATTDVPYAIAAHPVAAPPSAINWPQLGFHPWTTRALHVQLVQRSSIPFSGVVRRATEDDLEAITDFAYQLVLYEARLSPSVVGTDLRRATVRADLAALLRHPDGHILLAESEAPGSPPLGFIAGVVERHAHPLQWPLPLPPIHGHIYWMFVTEQARGQRIGTALVQQLMNIFAVAGVPCMTLDYMPANPTSPHFWQRQGFRPYQEYFLKIL